MPPIIAFQPYMLPPPPLPYPHPPLPMTPFASACFPWETAQAHRLHQSLADIMDACRSCLLWAGQLASTNPKMMALLVLLPMLNMWAPWLFWEGPLSLTPRLVGEVAHLPLGLRNNSAAVLPQVESVLHHTFLCFGVNICRRLAYF